MGNVEVWKPVAEPGYEDLYEVSSLGREIIAPHLETVTQRINKPLLKIDGRDYMVNIHEVVIEHDYMGGTTINLTTGDWE